ncbi:glycoside hydrolase family 2 TIM barrel-domain containing protein [Segetibacter aerophilus]|uniref:Beta-galactosidase n=1 Tax=Segetibacter aerophilus TaxID=670293 RepID=A0A512BA56_9BACT|nr:glycoside hydrolase family 2 TIM barrel-domain containing protein [Segetibacter aerophilus]GEO08830.1 beta-galactosidase [Segetibacter aerophilus]
MRRPNCYFLGLILFSNFILNSLLGQYSRRQSFNEGWKFFKGDILNAEKEALDDKAWRELDVPHDWSIEDLPNQSDSVIGPFSKASVGSTSTGYTVGGTAWYRKHFKTAGNGNKKYSIYFDGVYMDCDVWINGKHLGNHPYGYTGFSYDLTPHLHLAKDGRQNVLAVRVRNEGKNTRWYSGSGIYRNVWLTTTNSVFVKEHGVFISTVKASDQAADIKIKTIVSSDVGTAPATLLTRIKDRAGKIVSSVKSTFILEKENAKEIVQTINISHPSLWSPDHPSLYTAETEVWRNNRVIDQLANSFGVRSVEYSATKGLLINGKKTLLKGGSVHNDNGPLGSVAIRRAEEKKVELLKAYGFNAVRTSHNPPSKEFLNACDRLGLLVIDEAFDQWQLPKNPQDYHRFFNKWWQKDITSLVERDRNHPSVIIWSIGNEIKERVDSSGLAITKKLKDEIYKLDGTRPVSEALCDFWDNKGYKWDTTENAFRLFDIGGYNYMWQQYEPDHKKHPDRVMVGTESFAKNALDNWQQVELHPYVLGDFVWTAMDYIGETGIGHAELDTVVSVIKKWPWYNGYCGDIDLIGGKKPQSWYRDIVWKRSNLAMLVHAPIPQGHREVITQWGWPDEYPTWNFEGSEGKELLVNVYSNYPLVQVELNGKVIGEKAVSLQTRLTADFNILYEQGVLKAYGIEEGKKVDSFTLATTGKPAGIRLRADRSLIKADRNDLSYITAEVIDEAGSVIPNATIPVYFTITGNANIEATGNANPAEMASFKQSQRNTFRGRCLAIVRPVGKPGKVILKAKAQGLKSAEILIEIK